MVRLRGVGKDCLAGQDAHGCRGNRHFHSSRGDSPKQFLPALLLPQLRQALLRLSLSEQAKQLANRGLRALAGFAKAFKLKYQDIEVGLDLAPEVGLADNGDLESDLAILLEQVGRAARAAGTAVIIFLDEIQYIEKSQFAALISALHRCSQENLPLTVVGAGLPQLRALAGDAKSYAERLFDFPMVGPLLPVDARIAMQKPAEQEGTTFTADALDAIIDQTKCYPYFLQEMG